MEILKCEAVFTEAMLGTAPKNKDIYSKFIESKQAEGRPDTVGDKETDGVPEIDGFQGWTGFREDEKGLYLLDYMLKGALKEAGNTLKEELKETNLKSKINKYVFVFPRKIYILDENKAPLKAPDGIFERPLRAQTAQGERIALAKSDQVNAGRRLEFEIHLPIEATPIKHIHTVLDRCMGYWRYMGLGQFRNGSFGRCEAKVVGK